MRVRVQPKTVDRTPRANARHVQGNHSAPELRRLRRRWSPEIGHNRTILRDYRQCRWLDRAIVVADRLDCQFEPIQPVRRRFYDVRTARLITTQDLYVRVMHMARSIVLAMPSDEANRLGAALQHAFDCIGHLSQIDRVLDPRAAAFRFDDDSVVKLYAVIARRSEFGIEVERAYPETRVLAPDNGEHLLRRIGVIILAVVEISQRDMVLEAACNRLQLRRRGEAAAEGGVEMRVVPIERNV